MLWPLMGWLEFPQARIVAALALAAATGWLAIVLIKESGAQTRLERAFVVALVAVDVCYRLFHRGWPGNNLYHLGISGGLNGDVLWSEALAG